jgi:hypothetical protein
MTRFKTELLDSLVILSQWHEFKSIHFEIEKSEGKNKNVFDRESQE